MFKEFKEFISKGNVVDMAVGLVTGSAFTAIVTSLVNDVISPLIGLAVGGLNFSEYRWVLRQAGVDANGNEIAEVAVKYGSFIQAIFNFLIVAFCIFMVVKAMNKMREAADKGVNEVLGVAGKLANKMLGKEEAAETTPEATVEEAPAPVEEAPAPAPVEEAPAPAEPAVAALGAMATEEIELLKEIRDLLKKE